MNLFFWTGKAKLKARIAELELWYDKRAEELQAWASKERVAHDKIAALMPQIKAENERMKSETFELRKDHRELTAKLIELQGVKKERNAALAIVSALVEEIPNVIEIPDRHCSCHTNPPCSDCHEWGHFRELMADAKKLTEKQDNLLPPANPDA